MRRIKAIIYESELKFIANCVMDYPHLETGGDFFGYWNKEGMPVVQFVTGPGINTTRTNTSFFQDIKYLHQCGNFLHSNFALEHIGSWHSHHSLALDYPSNGDINTMRNCLENPNVEKFFISISNIKKSDLVGINGFLFSKAYSSLYEWVKWAVLQGDSPIRKECEARTDFFSVPRNKKTMFYIDEVPLSENTTISLSEKIELSPESYFETDKGRKFLKREYEKLNKNRDFENVEIVQNEDKTIGITFTYDGKEAEIRYPLDFSESNPNPIMIYKNEEPELKKKNIEVNIAKIYFFRPNSGIINQIKNAFVRKPKKSTEGKREDNNYSN